MKYVLLCGALCASAVLCGAHEEHDSSHERARQFSYALEGYLETLKDAGDLAPEHKEWLNDQLDQLLLKKSDEILELFEKKWLKPLDNRLFNYVNVAYVDQQLALAQELRSALAAVSEHERGGIAQQLAAITTSLALKQKIVLSFRNLLNQFTLIAPDFEKELDVFSKQYTTESGLSSYIESYFEKSSSPYHFFSNEARESLTYLLSAVPPTYFLRAGMPWLYMPLISRQFSIPEYSYALESLQGSQHALSYIPKNDVRDFYHLFSYDSLEKMDDAGRKAGAKKLRKMLVLGDRNDSFLSNAYDYMRDLFGASEEKGEGIASIIKRQKAAVPGYVKEVRLLLEKLPYSDLIALAPASDPYVLVNLLAATYLVTTSKEFAEYLLVALQRIAVDNKDIQALAGFLLSLHDPVQQERIAKSMAIPLSAQRAHDIFALYEKSFPEKAQEYERGLSGVQSFFAKIKALVGEDMLKNLSQQFKVEYENAFTTLQK